MTEGGGRAGRLPRIRKPGRAAGLRVLVPGRYRDHPGLRPRPVRRRASREVGAAMEDEGRAGRLLRIQKPGRAAGTRVLVPVPARLPRHRIARRRRGGQVDVPAEGLPLLSHRINEMRETGVRKPRIGTLS